MVFLSECLPSRVEESLIGEEPKDGCVYRLSVSIRQFSLVSALKRDGYPLRFFLKKADRILKRHEFVALSKSGRRLQNEHFIAIFAAAQFGRSRLGITVTKKVGKAVERNRIKRFVREFFRLNRHLYSGKWDINIIAKRQIAGVSAEKVYRALQDIFHQISNYDDHQ
jgi:ribonuclease P protein component